MSNVVNFSRAPSADYANGRSLAVEAVATIKDDGVEVTARNAVEGVMEAISDPTVNTREFMAGYLLMMLDALEGGYAQ